MDQRRRPEGDDRHREELRDQVDARALKAVLEESGVGTAGGMPRLIDTDRVPTSGGARTGEHFVLEKDGAIFDPWPRRDGKQTVPANSDAAKRYQESYID